MNSKLNLHPMPPLKSELVRRARMELMVSLSLLLVVCGAIFWATSLSCCTS